MPKPNDFPTRSGTRILRLLLANPWQKAEIIGDFLGLSGPNHALKALENQTYVIRRGCRHDGYLWACSPLGSSLAQLAIELEIGEIR